MLKTKSVGMLVTNKVRLNSVSPVVDRKTRVTVYCCMFRSVNHGAVLPGDPLAQFEFLDLKNFRKNN